MPYDSSGKATIYRKRALFGEVIEAEQVNIPFDDTQSMLSQALLRNGLAPMSGNLNLNSNRITNLQVGVNPSDAVTLSQLNAFGSPVLNSTLFAGNASLMAASGYATNSIISVKAGETAKLVCNPSGGDDLQDMANWASYQKIVEQGGQFYIEIADGLHSVTTYIDVSLDGILDIRGTAAPATRTVTGATFSADGGGIYTATITVSSALPAQVAIGYAVGGQNIQGDGAADLLNGGMTVQSVAGDRLSFTVKVRCSGVAPTSFTTPDSTPSLGLTPNQIVIPTATIRANEAGWDGAAREGFMNALSGGKIRLSNIGFSYNGLAGDNDMFFARDEGSEINFVDYVVVAGSGEMITRSFNQANIVSNRSFLGGDTTTSNVFQGSGGGKASFTRTMMGSVSGDGISSSSGCSVQMGLSVLSGANQGLRTTNPDSSIIATGCRISRCLNGVASTKGDISIDANSSIQYCTNPISLAGGFVHGNPTIANNTNSAPAAGVYSANGGAWIQTPTRIADGSFFKIGRFTSTLTYGAIPANTGTSNYLDLTVSTPGAAFGDIVFFNRTGTWPAQTVTYNAFVSAADVTTVRATNNGSGTPTPTAFTAVLNIFRSP